LLARALVVANGRFAVTFTPFKTTTMLLTNDAYGNYGGRAHGSARRVKPSLLMCMHITDGDETQANRATHNVNERNYANRAGSNGPSAHDYIAQDGSVIHAINAPTYAAWSNGDLMTPNRSLQIVKTILAGKTAGYNPNELFYREVECCGNRSRGLPVSAAQAETVAQMIARDSISTGIPISRATVGTHADINSVTRAGCAFPPATREAKLAAIITRAKVIKAEIQTPTPPPPPATYTQAQLDAAVTAATKEGYDDGFADGEATSQLAGAQAEWDRQFGTSGGAKIAPLARP
jgi:hypothetical protein